MRKQPRNVVGDEQAWAGMIPGLGLMNYILGLLTVPIEVFLRRDFGERHYTRMNFIGGLIILILWNVVGGMFGMLTGGFGITNFLFNRSGSDTSSWMGGIIYLYVFVGILHFLTIWWKDITGKPVHSFSAGRSWLRPLGWVTMWIMNLVLDNVVRLGFVISRADKSRLPMYLPVLQDVNNFTERFIEPLFVLYLANKCFAAGQGTVGWWLIFSVMALNMYTGLRHQAERSNFLDYRDQAIEARGYGQMGTSDRASDASDRLVRRTAREVERNPDILPIIERENPTLASALEKLSPKLKAIAEKDADSGNVVINA